jgi:tetratricopeptide (TPR) repeat protein
MHLSISFILITIALFLTEISYAVDVKDINKLIEDKKYIEALKAINNDSNASNSPQLLFLKGVLLAETSQEVKAIEVFEMLTKTNPLLPEPYNNLAVLYANRGDYQSAQNALEKAIKTHPSYATAHVNLGDLYTRMASEAYNKALAVDGSNKLAKTKLSLIKKLFNFQPIAKDVNIFIDDVKTASNVPAENTTSNKDNTALSENKSVQSNSDVFNQENVEQFIERWRNAWASKDFDVYIKSYSQDFTNSKISSYADWAKYRKPRIIYKDKIEINIAEIKIQKINDKKSKITFKQEYKSGNINSLSTKFLILINEDDQIKIINEDS